MQTFEGFCPICEQDVIFAAENSWFRDHLLCPGCSSIPRERALMVALDQFAPNWRVRTIHESSPGTRGVSPKLQAEARSYIPTQYFPGAAPGAIVKGFRNENFSKLTFADNSIDIHISQDVMEHVFDIDSAFAEISRTLKPGGMHIFTVPVTQRTGTTVQRASIQEGTGKIVHLLDPVYHGNPVSSKGSLVVWDWGYDIVQRIHKASDMYTVVMLTDDITRGIRAEYNDVLISINTAN